MTENKNTRAYRQGIAHERERIIRLLSENYGCHYIPEVNETACDCGGHIDESTNRIIDLINGK